MSEELKKIVDYLINGLSEFGKQIVKVISEIDFTSLLLELNELIESSRLSEEEKNNVKELSLKWAQHGLFIPKNMEYYLINCPPNNNFESEEICNKYLDNENFFAEVDELKKIKYLKKSDLNDLKSFYENKKYKVCVMLIFSFIDCLIINSQPLGDYRRKLPGKIKDIKSIPCFSDIGLLFFETHLIYSLLSEYYKDADDFRDENKYKLINRNFIQHGMSSRIINKYDVLKLFSLLCGIPNTFNLIER